MKAIRWQINFVSSILKTPYRIDIYDEQDGSWSGITQLLGSISTSEDSNSDYFKALRNHTGSLNICTQKPDGTMLELDDIMPASNLSRPVRLLNMTDTQNPSVVWQGFLSCEVYSQDYIGIPQEIQLNIISVLEAMDSVEVALSEDMCFNKIIAHIAYALRSTEQECGMSLFEEVCISDYCFDAILNKNIYNNTYFNIEEQIEGDNIIAEIHSISCKQILEQIAQFFGCCWREQGKDIYLECVGKPNSFKWHYAAYIESDYLDGTSHISNWFNQAQRSIDIANQTWVGTGHKRNSLQGARRVKVEAKLEDFDVDIKLRDCPLGLLDENPTIRQSTWGEVYCNLNETFYNLAEHRHYRVLQRTYYDVQDSNRYKAQVSLDTGQQSPFVQAISQDTTFPWLTNAYLQDYNNFVFNQEATDPQGIEVILTSFMGLLREDNEGAEDPDENKLQSGLMVCGLPKQFLGSQGTLANAWFLDTLTPTDIQYYVFRQNSGLYFRGTKGKLKFDMDIMACMTQRGIVYKDQFASFERRPGVRIGIRVGNNWVYQSGNNYLFSNTFQTIDTISDANGKVSIEIPITALQLGIASVYIYPVVGGYTADYSQTAHYVFITQIGLSYEPDTELQTERGSNVYANSMDVCFKEEQTVGVNMATDANNSKLATMLWEDATTPSKLITLGSQTIRPEVDLLNRLAAYYGVSQKRIELEVLHPYYYQYGVRKEEILPILQIRDLNESKTYIPLSESRDWQTDVCKLTCFETPTEPQESQS